MSPRSGGGVITPWILGRGVTYPQFPPLYTPLPRSSKVNVRAGVSMKGGGTPRPFVFFSASAPVFSYNVSYIPGNLLMLRSYKNVLKKEISTRKKDHLCM